MGHIYPKKIWCILDQQESSLESTKDSCYTILQVLWYGIRNLNMPSVTGSRKQLNTCWVVCSAPQAASPYSEVPPSWTTM